MARASWLALVACACVGGAKSGDRLPGDSGDTGLGVSGWQVVGQGLPAALLSVWGSSPTDVWAIGADPGDGQGPLFVHYDGAAWTRLDTGTVGDLWWIWSDGGDQIVLSGDGGRVVTFTRASGLFREATVGDTTLKLFGVWGTSPDDLIAVGGNISSFYGKIYHFDGLSWRLEHEDGARMVYKVWGSATQAPLAIGTRGLGLRWDGVAWRPLDFPTTQDFFTVAGAGEQVYAVGGFGNGAVMRLASDGWVAESPPPQAVAPGFRGVAVGDNGVALAVGEFGAVFTRSDEGWVKHPDAVPTQRGFHGAWVDPEGGQWAVGGDLTRLTEGTIVYNGPRAVVPYGE